MIGVLSDTLCVYPHCSGIVSNVYQYLFEYIFHVYIYICTSSLIQLHTLTISQTLTDTLTLNNILFLYDKKNVHVILYEWYMHRCSFWFGRPEMSPSQTCTIRLIRVRRRLRGWEWKAMCHLSLMSSWLGQSFLQISFSGSNNLQDVQKEVDDVQVEIQCGKSVVINGELHFMSTP